MFPKTREKTSTKAPEYPVLIKKKTAGDYRLRGGPPRLLAANILVAEVGHNVGDLLEMKVDFGQVIR